MVLKKKSFAIVVFPQKKKKINKKNQNKIGIFNK